MAIGEQSDPKYGDTTNLKLVRVTDGGVKSRFLGYMLIIIKHSRSAEKETITIRIQPISQLRSTAQISDKFSLNKFEATVSHSDRTIAFGPIQGVQLEENIQNRGVGTYALNELLLILRAVAPSYNFIPYEVTLPEGTPDDKKNLLETFLNKFNIPITFSDPERRLGMMRASTPQHIINHYNQDKIQEVDVEEFLVQLMADKSKNENEIASMKTEISKLNDETMGGLSKDQLIKYTLMVCGITIALIFFLLQ